LSVVELIGRELARQSAFLRAQAQGIVACDFFTVEMTTPGCGSTLVTSNREPKEWLD
jgi:hypothetical protein